MIRRPLALLALWLGAALPALAQTYRCDVIVFQNLWATDETGNPAAAPNLKGAIELDDTARLRAAGIELLPDDQFGLNEEWQRLRGSKQFRPLMRIAWTQKDPPSERGPALHIKVGAAAAGTLDPATGQPPVPPVDGSVALLLSRYLHLDADIQYFADGLIWPLDERRKMRRDEVHHLDSARLGILTKVSKADATGGDSAAP